MSGQAVAALQAALAAENAACYGYGVVGAHLAGTGLAATAASDWVAHQRARDSLIAMITAAGADPVPASVAYRLPAAVSTAAEARALAVMLEDGVAQAYIGLVGLTDLKLRARGARGLQSAALRAAAWRHGTVAFPGLPGPGAGRSGG
jgi:Domain of unknown function (DUF4439)